MTELETWAPRALSVHVPPGGRRKPAALVRLAVGPLELVLVVSRLKRQRSGLAALAPTADGGAPAISADPEVWAEIEKAAVAAVAADAAAREHVLGKPFRRAGEAPPAAPGPAPT